MGKWLRSCNPIWIILNKRMFVNFFSELYTFRKQIIIILTDQIIWGIVMKKDWLFEIGEYICDLGTAPVLVRNRTGLQGGRCALWDFI